MRSLLLPFAVLAAVAVLAGVGWVLFAAPGGPPPAPVRPAPPSPAPGKPVFAPEEEPPEEEEEPPPPPAEPAPAPDAWPGEVPAWWIEADRRFRDGEVSIQGETLTLEEYFSRIEGACSFPVRFEDALAAKVKEIRVNMPSGQGTGRNFIEALSSRFNMEPVLEPDALRFYVRGRAPDTREVRAGRIRWAVLESVERREGKRPPVQDPPDLEAVVLDLPLDRVPLREASRLLTERISIPVYLDGPLWVVNPPVTVEAGPRTLASILDAMVAKWGGAVDATPRRIVLFKPPR